MKDKHSLNLPNFIQTGCITAKWISTTSKFNDEAQLLESEIHLSLDDSSCKF